jgi:hypothetical protein
MSGPEAGRPDLLPPPRLDRRYSTGQAMQYL